MDAPSPQGPTAAAPADHGRDAAAGGPRSELRGDFGPVLASMVGLAFSVGTLGFTYSIGPFIKPLTDEFGWSRQQLLGVQPFLTVAVIAVSVLLGWVADRHGVRRYILASQLLFGLGFFATAAWLESLTSFYVLYFLTALGAGATTSIGFSRLLAQRYDRQRGLALGIANSGTGLCGFLVPPYATWAIGEFGWRGGYVALGLLPLCLALPLAWRYLHDQPAHGLPAGAGRGIGAESSASATASGSAPSAAARPGSGSSPGLSFAQVLRGRQFWLMSLALFCCSGVMAALITNIVPLMQEQGHPASVAALVAAGFGVAVVIGRVTVGALIDRYWAPLVGAALMFPAALAVVGLALWHPGPLLAGAVVFVAGLAAGAEVDLMAYVASRYFGLREFGRIFAALYVGFALGPGVALPLFGRARDLTGGYEFGLLGVAAGIAAFGVLMLMLGPYPDFGRRDDAR